MTNQFKPTIGMPILYDGNKVTYITKTIADSFQEGDLLKVIDSNGQLLHIKEKDFLTTEKAVLKAKEAFYKMGSFSEDDLNNFYTYFIENLSNNSIWDSIISINKKDIESAQLRGRSTTRLYLNEKTRYEMIDGLKDQLSTKRHIESLNTFPHGDWQVDLEHVALGVVGFVFEGRPNVVVDATGVLRQGNTVVFRIGSDALNTAKAILQFALKPALEKAGLPKEAISLIDSSSHGSGWALFSNKNLSLAVARGSGKAVLTLGSLANQAGIPVSLHGTGGAWMIADNPVNLSNFENIVHNSLDRKVCNTLNTICIPKKHASTIIPALINGLTKAAQQRNHPFKLHVVKGDESYFDPSLFHKKVSIKRLDGIKEEHQAETIEENSLHIEWEWEESPEISVKIVDDLDDAIQLCNQYSPKFVVSLICDDPKKQLLFSQLIDAPFIGNGFTRWVDGQYALNSPELGLSNWEFGRPIGRGSILSGQNIYTLRAKMTQHTPKLKR